MMAYSFVSILLLWSALNQWRSFHESALSVFFRDEIHFMNQNKYRCVGAVLLHRFKNSIEKCNIILQITRVDVEDIDQHLNIPENSISLRVKVTLIEAVLATAVPQIKCQVAKETNMSMLNIHCKK